MEPSSSVVATGFVLTYSSLLIALISGVITLIGTIFLLRHNDRLIVIDNVTKERKEWRGFLRTWIGEVSENYKEICVGNDKYLKYRAQLVSRLNPADYNDAEIVSIYDEVFSGQESNNKITIVTLQNKIGCLLKQDWESVKNECTPFYKKWFSEDAYQRKISVKEKLYLTLKHPYSEEVKKGGIASKFDFEMDFSEMPYNKLKKLPLKSSILIVFILGCIWLPVKIWLSIYAFSYDYLRIGVSIVFLLFSGVVLDYYVFGRSIYKNTNIIN